MISTEGIIHNLPQNDFYLNHSEIENPFAIQLFGSKPESFLKAAEEIAEKYNFLFFDINAGCPVKKVVKKGAGAALHLDPENLQNIQKTLVKNFPNIPITTKIRLGWDHDSLNYVEIGKRSEDAGVRAVFLHGRTRSQFFSGKADWSHIKKLSSVLKIPVIGNGDVFTSEDAINMINSTNCTGVMIGRGMLGHPWIFNEIKNRIYDKNLYVPQTAKELINIIREHYKLCIASLGELKGIRYMRKHFVWYTKGWYNASQHREKVLKIENLSEISEYLNTLENKCDDIINVSKS